METTCELSVTGRDAFTFLQGQLTNDLRRLDAEPRIRAAWCNPKGRVIWFGDVRRVESGYVLTVPCALAEELARRLAMFRFRAKVDITAGTEAVPVDIDATIAAGLPWIGKTQSEAFTPHMLNLDLLDAISLTKGCYTGQEVVARTHYKGATKRRTLRFASSDPLAVGDKVSDGERDVGEVLNVADNALLAVVPVDRADAALVANGIPLTREALPYL